MRITTLLFLATLTGCASEPPPYPSYSGSDATCIKGDMAGIVKFFADGQPDSIPIFVPARR